MTNYREDYLWTLEDYQERLLHENYFVRHWAFDRITEQYPEQKVAAAALLIDDSDRHLQIEAIQALGKLGGAAHEAKLLALRPAADESTRQWITRALAEMHATEFLPLLLAEIRTLDLSAADAREFPLEYAAIDALGAYNEAEATALLWQLFERYPFDDTLAMHMAEALLKYPVLATVPHLIRRWQQLQPVERTWHSLGSALAELYDQRLLYDDIAHETDPQAQWELIGEWFDQEIAIPPTVQEVLDQVVGAKEDGDHANTPNALFDAYWAAYQSIAGTRGDDPRAWLAGWEIGETLTGYQQRALHGWQALETLTQLSYTEISRQRQAPFIAYGTLVLAHYLVDENDEERLVAVTNDADRADVLLAILASPRKTVLADLETQVAALGPVVVPPLVALLQADQHWPIVRALNVLAVIARHHPGSADTAVAAILDLLRNDDAGDFISEAAGDTLIAIGPAVVAPAVDDWEEEITYSIFVAHALANIPVQASVDALEARIRASEELTEMDWGYLVDLGQRQSIELIQAYFDGEHPHIATALYTLGALHNLSGPEMTLWGTLANAENERMAQIYHAMATGGPMPPVPEALRRHGLLGALRPARLGTSYDEDDDEFDGLRSTKSNAERQAKKKKRTMAKATKKAQRKAKKKKKR